MSCTQLQYMIYKQSLVKVDYTGCNNSHMEMQSNFKVIKSYTVVRLDVGACKEISALAIYANGLAIYALAIYAIYAIKRAPCITFNHLDIVAF